MKIAWDGRGLVGTRTGLGFHTLSLLSGFANITEPWTADLYLNHPIEDQFDNRIKVHCLHYPNTVRLRTFWEEVMLPTVLRQNPAEIWHSPISLVPGPIHIPTVATVHDVAFLRYPGILPAAYRHYWTSRIATACRMADHLIAISNCTRNDMCDFFDVNKEKIQVVPNACHPEFFNPPGEEELSAFRIRMNLTEPFFLFVGTLEPRKNLLFLLKVYEEICCRTHGQAPLLVIAGGKGWLDSSEVGGGLRSTEWQERVRFLGYTTRTDLRCLYRLAELMLVPSLYEGFGLQALEAMASSACVVAADVSSLPEVVGEAGFLLPLDDPGLWVDKILELTENQTLCRTIGLQASVRAQRFTETSMALKTLDVYRDLLGSD